MEFIDLFAGLGGFHKALHELGHKCVFASELNIELRELYKENWGITPYGDIRKITTENINLIPEHDILCAGFPCQPFSKAGKQLGREDEGRGDLFDEIIKILSFRKPKYFILENVAFIAQHDEEKTWNYIKTELEQIGYDVKQNIYSPQDFGIPQHRKRIFIVGSLNNLDNFNFSDIDKLKTSNININEFIDKNPIITKQLSKENIDCLNLWQEFIKSIPENNKIIGAPIWAMEFGATYPYEDEFPFIMSEFELGKYKGNFGKSLANMSKKLQFENLPSYARVEKEFPIWKKRYIKESRNFYLENKKHINNVVKKIANLPSQSWQKLEWNVGENERDIFKYILQFRASGIRVKKVDYFPSLVCTSTQIPIIGWQKRYITKEEGLKLQSLDGLKLPKTENSAFKALGNAVNAHIVKLIAEKLLIKNEIPEAKNILQHKIEGKQKTNTTQTFV
ncbi:DNA (cytosine-5-)-methyltransferase [Flavobacterium covae]|uniref:DNA cytosine methyltransferase n=1 Tax=Flavobacterium covae TaxID=2906076 RepID=UPI000B4D70DC|nr:DNA (cytosine-5-)-methyltransferase [Flavobacterium covae]OWP87410.1 DNA (cytosine-5-)-methyltransferase [Flavobacterium covae]